HRDIWYLRPTSGTNNFSNFFHGVRCRPIGCAGNLQEMRACRRLRPFLLPLLRAETGLKAASTRTSNETATHPCLLGYHGVQGLRDQERLSCLGRALAIVTCSFCPTFA